MKLLLNIKLKCNIIYYENRKYLMPILNDIYVKRKVKIHLIKHQI